MILIISSRFAVYKQYVRKFEFCFYIRIDERLHAVNYSISKRCVVINTIVSNAIRLHDIIKCSLEFRDSGLCIWRNMIVYRA